MGIDTLVFDRIAATDADQGVNAELEFSCDGSQSEEVGVHNGGVRRGWDRGVTKWVVITLVKLRNVTRGRKSPDWSYQCGPIV